MNTELTVRKRIPSSVRPANLSDQPVHARSLIRIFTVQQRMQRFFHADNEESDKTAQMRRLI